MCSLTSQAWWEFEAVHKQGRLGAIDMSSVFVTVGILSQAPSYQEAAWTTPTDDDFVVSGPLELRES